MNIYKCTQGGGGWRYDDEGSDDEGRWRVNIVAGIVANDMKQARKILAKYLEDSEEFKNSGRDWEIEEFSISDDKPVLFATWQKDIVAVRILDDKLEMI